MKKTNIIKIEKETVKIFSEDNKTLNCILNIETYNELKKICGYIGLNPVTKYSIVYIKSLKKQIYVHQYIIGIKTGFVIDHKNNNRIDNKIENLQHLTQKENCKKKKPSTLTKEQKEKNNLYMKKYYLNKKNKEKHSIIMKNQHEQIKYKKMWLSYKTKKVI